MADQDDTKAIATERQALSVWHNVKASLSSRTNTAILVIFAVYLSVIFGFGRYGLEAILLGSYALGAELKNAALANVETDFRDVEVRAKLLKAAVAEIEGHNCNPVIIDSFHDRFVTNVREQMMAHPQDESAAGNRCQVAVFRRSTAFHRLLDWMLNRPATFANAFAFYIQRDGEVPGFIAIMKHGRDSVTLEGDQSLLPSGVRWVLP